MSGGRGSEPGYMPQRKLYRLRFEDRDGFVVRARSAATGVFMEISTFADDATSDSGIKQEQLGRLFDLFSGVLVEWNLLEEDGTPVPATKAGLLSQEFDFVMEIITAWMDAVAGVAAPLEKPSSDGELFPEASIPMEPLSASQAS